MKIRIVHDDPKASISLALGEKDENGGVMIDHTQLEHAQAHGWRVEHEPPAPVKAAAPAADTDTGGDKGANADDPAADKAPKKGK